MYVLFEHPEPKKNGDAVSVNELVKRNIIELVATAGENSVSNEKINYCWGRGGGKAVNEDIVMAHYRQKNMNATERKIIVSNRRPDGFNKIDVPNANILILKND